MAFAKAELRLSDTCSSVGKWTINRLAMAGIKTLSIDGSSQELP